MDLKKLQNGSDIRGVASEGIAGQSVNLTDEAVEAIGRGFAIWLSRKLEKDILRVSVGTDSRISAQRIKDALTRSLTSMGIDVADFGLASTPAMFMSTVTDGFMYDGAIMITASHLPFNRNGLKFFTRYGGLEKADIASIIEIGEAGDFEPLDAPGKTIKQDFISKYSNILADKIRQGVGLEKPLQGFRIVVDAGNGAGGFFASKVLEPLGANTAGSQYLEPDGTFPNHIPNPEDKAAAQSIVAAVNMSQADLGIIFDTDVDRAGAVDAKGNVINKNRLIALMAAILLEEHPGTTVVTDSTTSAGLKDFIESKGGVHRRFRRGYKNVINESIRLNNLGVDSQIAIETSGHGALKENYFLDDGAYLIVKILIKMAKLRKEGKTLFELIADLKEPAEATEFRLNIADENFKAYGQKILDELEQYAQTRKDFAIAPDNFEGIRVSVGSGWFLLRLSLHDPLMPLNIESDTPGGVKKIAGILADILSKYDKLDISSLRSI